MSTADVIIAKGQANTETLYGCGYNIYYAFLVKCPRFVELFGKKSLAPMLVRERKQETSARRKARPFAVKGIQISATHKNP